jgi:hypothetical protein
MPAVNGRDAAKEAVRRVRVDRQPRFRQKPGQQARAAGQDHPPEDS